MDKKLAQLELQKIFQLDALELINAHNRAKVIHNSKDISASGDEVEIIFREILKRKLPNRYYIGHGHIVDKLLNSSPQFDVVIANNTNAPILFRTQKGSEYFPYESVYAIGEVKASYLKKDKPIEKFVGNIKRTKSSLQREETPPNDTGIGISSSQPLTVYPYRNPLFSFMIFVSSNDFQLEDIREFYLSTNVADLPNIICLLDKGVIVNMRVKKTQNRIVPESFNIIPEFNKYLSNNRNHYYLLHMGESTEFRAGSNLSHLYLSLFSHLEQCKLKNPNLEAYLDSMLHYEQGQIIDWTPPKTIQDLISYSDNEHSDEILTILNIFGDEQRTEILNMSFEEAMQKIHSLIPSLPIEGRQKIRNLMLNKINQKSPNEETRLD